MWREIVLKMRTRFYKKIYVCHRNSYSNDLGLYVVRSKYEEEGGQAKAAAYGIEL
jgi:hypothetical protein